MASNRTTFNGERDMLFEVGHQYRYAAYRNGKRVTIMDDRSQARTFAESAFPKTASTKINVYCIRKRQNGAEKTKR